ncbi:hypothetical protein G3T36_04765 [Diaminobutyricibacter tongyongensis]|uniref:Uncharacterized protein n=1 Tax=Leifsonia tongyongensis TaxID=1268043 RepID=A0A6L9XVD0_9MICO|nr:hypothetical protein [Diaminobutyricibacter tongyongensis]NEN05177.1 hypothetical protein [Diaminobutyricibacter tongyongensis]
MSPEAPESGPVGAWSGLLDRFEDEIRRVNRGETTELPDWSEPDAFPPLPAELAGRARSILERQRSTAERASAARREIGRELAAVRAIPATTGSQLPRYIDRLA